MDINASNSLAELMKIEFDPVDLSRTLHDRCIIFKPDGFKLNEVEKALKSAKVSTFNNDQIVLEINERVHGVYVVLEGSIHILLENDFFIIEPMDYFGIECLVNSQHFSKRTYQSAGVSKIACEYSQN